MVGILMRVGPKGQVVIPQQIREYIGIMPGHDILFDIEDDHIKIERPRKDLVAALKKAAKSAITAKIDIIHGIEEEYDQRWQRSRRST